MTIHAASGKSSKSDTSAAITDAVEMAKGQLKGKEATAGFLFASSSHDLKQALAVAKTVVPNCEWLACHTAGEFTEAGKTAGGMAVMLTTLEKGTFGITSSTGVRNDPARVGKELTADFASLKAQASARGAPLSTTVMLVDGLASTGEQVVKEVMQHTRTFQQVVGGASGDDGKFTATQVATHSTSGTDMAAVMHAFGRTQWGVGVDHGLSPRTASMTVTRAQGTVLYEIDNKPAIEAYRTFAKSKGVELNADNTSNFLIGNELGVFFLKELHHARAPVGVGPKGELNLVAHIAEGEQVCILDGEPAAMVAACGRAAEAARASLKGVPAAGVLVFDCVCRGMILKEGFNAEIEAVKKAFPGVPVAGFLTYGEIARFRGRLDGWHNTTAVVVAIPAD